MPDLSFAVDSAEVVRYAAAPLVGFKLRVENSIADEPIHTIALRCQVQIDATRRHYGPDDHERLLDLFGERARWNQTLRSLLWTFVSVVVPPFTDSTVTDLYVPCTFDLNVATAKYFYALSEGEVPLTFLFSGTVFYESDDSALQVAQIPWEKEARYVLPLRVWQETLDHYYPNSAWLTLQRDVFDQLYRYKMNHALPTWEQAIESLLVVEKNEF